MIRAALAAPGLALLALYWLAIAYANKARAEHATRRKSRRRV